VLRYSSFDTSATSAIVAGSDDSVNPDEANLLKRFAVALALCHNLGIEASGEAGASIEYRAESPDEAALAAGAAQLDVVFLGRKQNRVMLREFGKDRVYTLEVTVPFDSDRKRMTVVVRADDGSYMVFTKGADTIMFPLLAPSHSQLGSSENSIMQAMLGHLNDFSSIGLRTLVFAFRLLTEEQGARPPSRLRDHCLKCQQACLCASVGLMRARLWATAQVFSSSG
jgi:phospholipid-translocating ATPase